MLDLDNVQLLQNVFRRKMRKRMEVLAATVKDLEGLGLE